MNLNYHLQLVPGRTSSSWSIVRFRTILDQRFKNQQHPSALLGNLLREDEDRRGDPPWPPFQYEARAATEGRPY
jgi:hypothetical protein